MASAKPTPGITARHGKGCASRAARACDCTPTFQAWVTDARRDRGQEKVYKTFPNIGAAKSWRQDMLVAVRRGEIAATTPSLTVSGLVDEWVADARRGAVRTRGRKPFAGSTLTSIEQNHRLRVAPRFGRHRIDRVALRDLQEWVDELDAAGLHPSTIETTVLPLRVAYRRAKTRGDIAVDPTDGLELPQKPMRGSSRRPPAAEDLRALLAVTPPQDRCAWTTLLLAGVRRGELQGLRWEDVDLEGGLMHVVQQYAQAEGIFKPTKGRRQRKLPISATLAAELRAHRLATGRRDGLVFGANGTNPLDAGKLQDRADAAWKAAGVDRVTPHVCRHLYATLMAAAGVQLHALSRFMGHSSIAVTFDNYGHLFPGEEAAAATLQDAFLAAGSVRGTVRDPATAL